MYAYANSFGKSGSHTGGFYEIQNVLNYTIITADSMVTATPQIKPQNKTKSTANQKIKKPTNAVGKAIAREL